MARGLQRDVARAQLIDIYAAIDPIARDLGVIISVEAARAGSVFNSPSGGAELVREFRSDFITLAPDLESSRSINSDMPSSYAENPDARQPEPFTFEQFVDHLPISPFVHAKVLDIDHTGSDPNYPMREILAATAASPLAHDLTVQYEGWVPDVHPEKDTRTHTAAAVRLVPEYRGPRS